MARKDRARPAWVGNQPKIAKYVARCQGCGIEGRTVDPVPPRAPYGHWLKIYYEPLYDGRCAQCAALVGDV